MKVSIGRVVIVRGITSNGCPEEHPALVNRAWADHDTKDGPVMANLTVFPDMAPPLSLGSVYVYDTKEQAEAAQLAHAQVRLVNPESRQTESLPALIVAHWPERV